jgi:hypothetical protein
MKTSELKQGYTIFGNKGNVWSNTAHIYESGKGIMCGTPALSNNWAEIEKVEDIGCKECLEKYQLQIIKEQTLEFIRTKDTDLQTLEFAKTIREAHIQILKALETLQKNAFFTTDWIDNNGVLYSLSFEIEKNLEDVLFNDLFKVVDVLKEKGVDYQPINLTEFPNLSTEHYAAI